MSVVTHEDDIFQEPFAIMFRSRVRSRQIHPDFQYVTAALDMDGLYISRRLAGLFELKHGDIMPIRDM